MAKYIKNAFGVSGDLVNVPDDTQVDGSISYNQGYTDPYQRDPSTDPTAKRIERAKMNKLFNDVTSNIKEWQEQTYPDWISDDGSGSPFAYGSGAIVKYTDGNNYASLVDNNTEEPTTGSNWQLFDATNFVSKTGNETIAGVKTFTSFPITPSSTPTTNYQVANKKYVDDNAGDVSITDFTGVNQSLSTSGYQKLPGGLIIQWGEVLQDSLTAVFPISFPNAVLQVAPTDSGSADLTGNISMLWRKDLTTLSTAHFSVYPSSGAGIYQYLAIGH